MLEKKNTHLTLLEDVAWQEAGISNQDDTGSILYADDHTSQRKQQIEGAKQEIIASVEKRVLSLASGESPKLLTSGESYDTAFVQEHALAVKEKLTEMALEQFKSCVPEIERLANERSNVLGELVGFSAWEYYPQYQQLGHKLDIVLEQEGKVFVQCAYEIQGKKATNTDVISHQGVSLDELKSTLDGIVKSGTNVAILSVNKELDLLLQMGHVLRAHISTLEGS